MRTEEVDLEREEQSVPMLGGPREFGRIGLISRVFPPIVGGSGKWLFEVYRRFQDGTVCVAAGDYSPGIPWKDPEGLSVSRHSFQMPGWGVLDFATYLRYRALIAEIYAQFRANGVTQVHSGTLLPDAWIGAAVARRLRVPHWVFVHGEEMTLGRTSRQLRMMGQLILRGATGVVANSQNTRAILSEYWGLKPGKVVVLNPGVDSERFVPVARDASVRASLGWDERPVVLTVGRLQARKGQDMMIKAWPKVIQKVPDALYAVIGGGEDELRLRQLVDDLRIADHVLFHGAVNDETMLQAFQQCDLFALPNREIDGDIEGFGIVLLEAQSCGKPVIAGRSGGTAETMVVGETGLLVDCSAPAELEVLVPDLLNDQSRLAAMGERARVHISSKFHWDALAGNAALVFSDAAIT